MGNQHYTNYSDKVDITPENNAPAIEYIYKDKNGNYTTNSAFPANVPVKGVTGQSFTITNVNNYLKVLNGYYLTNQPDGLANTANGKDYAGTIAQFQIGKYYEKTLYNWDRSVSQTLIYELIDPEGTMNISLLRPGYATETRTVPVGKVDQFSNNTLARNPFVPGTTNVQLIYADLGHIIPVDENGNVISNIQPIYNNDPNDAHKAAATAAPDLTAQGWVLANPSQATITPVNPGADTPVQYVRVIKEQEEKKVSQTVQYKYADGITEGRPALPSDNVQSVTFTHTIITNPVTGKVISDTWTPNQAQQFTVVNSPEINGFYADQAQAGGNNNVTQDTPDTTFVVLYAGPNVENETRQVTQTVRYEYQDGITEGRPALPEANKQTLTFTRTIKRDPSGNVISDEWSPAQNFTIVNTPEIDGYYYDRAQAGSTDQVTYQSADTEYVVYYAAPTISTREKNITQTIHYQYQDGETQDRPALPADNVQTLTFTETLGTNPFTGHVVSFGWKPSSQKFQIVQTPEISGFYADLAQAGSDKTVVHEDSDTYYVVNYAAPTSTVVETKTVTQTIRYHYAKGVNGDPALLPKDDIQVLTFQRTMLVNPWTNEIVSDNWSPVQHFTIVDTPTINGFFFDQSQAGSNAAVTHESPDTVYDVYYLAAETAETTKQITQTIRYEYADGVTEGRPALPATNVQTLTFKQTIKRDPVSGAIISDEWTAPQRFSIVNTPVINGFYYDLAQAGSNELVTHDDANTEYVVKYAPAKAVTESKTVTQTIRYHYANGVNGNPALLPKTNVQSLTFTRTTLTNPWTDEVVSGEWSPAQHFTVVDTPTINGYFFDQGQAGSDAAVTHDSSNTTYDVYYFAPETTETTKQITQTVRYEYADGVTEGRPALPATNVQTLTFKQTIKRDPVSGAIISDEWTAPQRFSIVNTPNLDGYYYDLAQAGSNELVTHDGASTEYVVKYAPAKVATESTKVKQTIKYVYADGETAGRPTLPNDNVQILTFTHTVTTNPFTGEVISDTWTPEQTFTSVESPTIKGFYPDRKLVEGQTVSHSSQDLMHVVQYIANDEGDIPDNNEPDTSEPENPTPENPTPEAPAPDVSNPTLETPFPDVSNPAPEVSAPATSNPVLETPGSSVSTKPFDKNSERLPQTGKQNTIAITGLGIFLGMLGLKGFAKRKDD